MTGKGSCQLNIYGGCTFNSMSLSLTMSSFTKTVKSSDFYFPISWRFNVGLYKLSSQSSATYKASDKYQFLPGSSLEVGKGVSLTSGSLVFYNNRPSSVSSYWDWEKEKWYSTSYTLTEVSSTVSDAWKRYYYTSSESRDPAYLLDNGTVEASTFAGLLKSNVEGATIKITSSYKSINYQPLKNTSSGTTDNLLIIGGRDMNTYMKIENTATYSDEENQISATGTYTSSLLNGSYGFFKS